jgi:hypothetical protein
MTTKLTTSTPRTGPMHANRPSDHALARRAATAERDDMIEALCGKAPQQQCTLLRATHYTTDQIAESLKRLVKAGRLVREGSSAVVFRYMTPATQAKQARAPAPQVNIVPCKEWLQPAPAAVTEEVIEGRTVRVTRVGPPPDRWACSVPATGGAITRDWLAHRQTEAAKAKRTARPRFDGKQASPALATAIEARRQFLKQQAQAQA